MLIFKHKPDMLLTSNNCEQYLRSLGFDLFNKNLLHISTEDEKSILAQWYKLSDRLIVEYLTVVVWECHDLDYSCLKNPEYDDRYGGLSFGQVWRRTSDNTYDVEIMFDKPTTDKTMLKLNCVK